MTLHALQDAARAAAREVCPDVTAARVLVLAPDGDRLLDVTLCVAPQSGTEEVDGWRIAAGTVTFEGAEVSVTPRELDVLKVLLRTEIVAMDELRKAWDGYSVEESTARWTIGQLRKHLADQFPDAGEVIETTGRGYRLLLRRAWVIGERVASYRGRPVRVSAVRLPLLRALVEAGGAPLTAKELVEVAFDKSTDTPNVRYHLRELRRELKAAIPGAAGEIIAGTNGGYTLNVH